MLGSYNNVDLPTVSKISISDLLDYVNKYFADALPEDVLKHYGYDSRPSCMIGESALYSTKLTPEEYARQKNYGCVFEDF